MSDASNFQATAENLRALLDQSLTAIFIVVGDRIRFVNQTLEEMLGYEAEALLEMDPWAPVHPDQRDAIRELARQRSQGDRSRDVYEARMLRKDGQEIWVEVRATAITYQEQPAVLVNMANIAERKRTEDRLRESEARFRSLFEQAPIGMYRADPDGRMWMANPALRRMLGRPADSEAPLHREDFEPTFPRSAFQKTVEAQGEVRGLESAWIRQDNSLLFVREYAQGVFDEQGDLQYVEGAVEDVTERKRSEQALQLFAQRLQIMQEVERAILAASSSEAIIEATVPRIRRLIPCQRAALLLFDHERATATVAAVDQEADAATEPVAGACLPLDHLSAMDEIAKAPLRLVDDLQRMPDPRPVHRRLLDQGLRSILCVPIRESGQLIGELNLASRKPKAFDTAKQKIAGEVAAQLAVGLRQARLLSDLRQQRERLQGLVEHLPEGLVLLDVERRILLANPKARRLLPLITAQDPLQPTGVEEGQVLETLGPHSVNPVRWQPGEVLGPEEIRAGERIIEVIGHPVPLAEEGGCVLVIREVTREREIARQLQQQERLAAIGELAGGVAHDFNNLLTAIDGFADLLRRRVAEDHPGRRPIEEIKRVCERGGALTRRLLAFSRRHDPVPESLDLNALILDVQEMLHRLLGSPVVLRLELAENLPPLLGHAEQLEQVLINLSINARDAMPEGGQLHIRTRVQDRPPELDGGQEAWIALEVEDTGCGMDEATAERIFEPFFTTREDAGGTGLGLSTVQGIVQGAGGLLKLRSQPGQGSLFTILLPTMVDPPNA